MSYAKIENGSVIAVLEVLPNAFTFPDGTQTGNFRGMDEATHIANGYYPLVEDKAAFDSAYQELAVSSYTIGESSVTRHWTAQDRDLATLKAERHGAIKALRAAKLDAGTLINGVFSVDAIYGKCHEHCTAIEALSTAQGVAEYDIEAGW